MSDFSGPNVIGQNDIPIKRKQVNTKQLPKPSLEAIGMQEKPQDQTQDMKQLSTGAEDVMRASSILLLGHELNILPWGPRLEDAAVR